jgi:membrane-bound metal-dependent hydrolase YbcI (DUF457 family)
MAGGVSLAAVGLGGLYWLRVYSPDPFTAAALLATAAIASLFPDVDTDSKGKRLYYACFAAVDIVLIFRREFRWASVVGLSAILPGLGPHRGWTHTWWAMLLVPLPVLLLPVYLYDKSPTDFLPYYIAAVTGYFSHLAMDGEF